MTLSWRPFASMLLAATVLGGCEADLGECNEAGARHIYYNAAGLPMYGGQALMHVSCGKGSFCHSAQAKGAYRRGVAKGFDFDMNLDTGIRAVTPALARLQRGQQKIYDEREDIYGEVSEGEMPPGGAAERETIGPPEAREVFTSAEGHALPDIRSSEAHDILRNWLACGSPVIERTAMRDDGMATTVGNVEPCGGRMGDEASCLVPEPTFTSIYEVLLAPRCGTVCHTPEAAEYFAQNMLDMSTRELAYASLVSVGAQGVACGPVGGEVRVRPGDADHSLLVNKLEGHGAASAALCGERMPLGEPDGAISAPVIAVLRDWIARGAPND